MPNKNFEKGYTRIANDLLQALAKTPLNTRESRILFAVITKTFTWHKQEDWISNNQIAQLTGISRANCVNTVTRLINRNILIKNGKNVSIQTNTKLWITNEEVVLKPILPSIKTDTSNTQDSSIKTDTHKRYKETNTKDNNTGGYVDKSANPTKKNLTTCYLPRLTPYGVRSLKTQGEKEREFEKQRQLLLNQAAQILAGKENADVQTMVFQMPAIISS